MLCLFCLVFSTDISFPIYNCKGTTSGKPDCSFLRFPAVFAFQNIAKSKFLFAYLAEN